MRTFRVSQQFCQKGGICGRSLRVLARFGSSAALAVSLIYWISAPLHAESIQSALAKAYANSPDLGQQRAAGRAADEAIPRAAGALRPTIAATGSAGVSNNRIQTPNALFGASVANTHTYPRAAGITVTQTLYNGERTINSVRQAESTALQGREQVRLSETTTLNSAASAYMNVLRDSALVSLNESNIRVLTEQLSQNNKRFKLGEITVTDIAQAEAALAQGQASLATVQGNLEASLAVYRQMIGEPPGKLEPARPLDFLIPKTVYEAIDWGLREHPQIHAALHQADAAELNVKVQEGVIYPTVAIQGSANQTWDLQGTPKDNLWQYSATANLNVPLYDGGTSYAGIRQAKEQLGQARLQVDVQRNSVRVAVATAWAALKSARANIRADRAQIHSNEVALAGVRQEALLGQRTTLDVLNAQQTLLNSRANLIGAQRDEVVQSYSLAAAMGRLSASELNLQVAVVDPAVHLDQVKGKIWGVRTPDGR